MTEPERKKWRVEDRDVGAFRQSYIIDSSNDIIGVIPNPDHAAHIVAQHNAGGEPVAYQCRRKGEDGEWSQWAALVGEPFENGLNYEFRPLYAAPVAPEPPTKVECLTPDEAWRDLVEKNDRTSPEDQPDMALITQAELADYMARAALARRPAGPTSAPPWSVDQFREMVWHVKTELWRRSALDVVLAFEKERIINGVHQALYGTGPTPATPVIDETRKLLRNWNCGETLLIQADAEVSFGELLNRFRSILAEHDAVLKWAQRRQRCAE